LTVIAEIFNYRLTSLIRAPITILTKYFSPTAMRINVTAQNIGMDASVGLDFDLTN